MTSVSAIVVVAVVCIGYANAYCMSGPIPSSCAEHGPICRSGKYLIDSGDIVYCSAEELCGSTGWTRVGAADFSDSETSCPEGLIEYNDRSERACKRESYSTTNSVILNPAITYKEVCGKVTGIQFGSPDAFDTTWTGNRDSVEDDYFDGISITHGNAGSRQHIFSLAAGVWEGDQCPCDTDSTHVAPSFVGNDYICESGDPDSPWEALYYPDDPLWDGQDCGGDEAPCCSTSPYSPYFYKDLGNYTNDQIELRIITNQDLEIDEDILLSSYEIYVK